MVEIIVLLIIWISTFILSISFMKLISYNKVIVILTSLLIATSLSILIVIVGKGFGYFGVKWFNAIQ